MSRFGMWFVVGGLLHWADGPLGKLRMTIGRARVRLMVGLAGGGLNQ